MQQGGNLLGKQHLRSETSSLWLHLSRDIDKREVASKLLCEFGRHVPSPEEADLFIQRNSLKPSHWNSQKIIRLHRDVCERQENVRMNRSAALTDQKAAEKAKHDTFCRRVLSQEWPGL